MEPSVARKVVLQSPRPLVIAHRGNSSEAPENTLPAFESAVKLKVDLIELDYYHSADGVPFAIHDGTLDRTTNAVKLWGGEKLPVTKYTIEQLRQLDAGNWFGAKFAGTRVPTLEESLDVIQAGSMTLIEHKNGDAKTCVELLRKKDLLDKVVVQSFNWKFLADCHALEPTLVLGALGSKPLTAERLDEIEACGAKVIGWNHKDLTERDIELVHKRGLKAWVYTVNEPARAQELIAAGIDGVITDVPAKMLPLVRPAAAE